LLRCARPEHTEKRKARFIQGDRLEDGAELAMTGSALVLGRSKHVDLVSSRH